MSGATSPDSGAYDYCLLDASERHRLDRIAPDVFDGPVDAVQLEAFIADPRHFMILAIHGDNVVGMLSAVEYLHPDKPPQMWINEVGVTPDHRRRGIGRELIGRLLDIAKARGCACAWLGTESDNVAARRCYDGVPDGKPAEAVLFYEWPLDLAPGATRER